MTNPDPRARKPLGCALVALAAVASVVGLGWYLGHRDAAGKTPCERYADVAATALKHCHSGQNTGESYQAALCEQQGVSPTEACLEHIKSMTCDELERGAAIAAGSVCLPPR